MASSRPNGGNSSAINNSTPNISSSFFENKRSIVAQQGLIYNCRKAQTKKVPKPCDKIQIKNKVKRKLRRRCKELNEDEKIWQIEFLSKSDIRYTSLGHKDHVYFGKLNGERKYK